MKTSNSHCSGGFAMMRVIAAVVSLILVAAEMPAKQQSAATIIISDTFAGAKGAAIAGRAPDTANAPGGKWSAVAFNTGGSFSPIIETSAGDPAHMAYLLCGGNANGAIAIPMASQGTYTKPQRFTISADLRGADPGLGFYSALPVHDPEGVFDVFSNFTGLQRLGDGTLVLYRKGCVAGSVKYTGTFDAKEFHKLSYDVDTRTGAISNVKLQGSTGNYSAFSVAGAFTDAATAYAAVASLCESGRDNQTYAGSFLVTAIAAPPSSSPAPVPAVERPGAANSSILVRRGEKVGFMGDSITALGNSPKGYVQLVVAGLRVEGIEAAGIPAGHSGDTSANMVHRTNVDVLHKGANWMTISCGVNDVAGQEHGYGCDLESFKKNVAGMVAKAQGWNVRVVLLTTTPIGEDINSKNNQKLAAYNDFLRSFAREKKLLLADVNAAFWAVLNSKPPAGAAVVPGKRLMADGLHPNDAGQFLMATTILEALGVPRADMPRVEKALRESTKGN